jgi:putative membrane protein
MVCGWERSGTLRLQFAAAAQFGWNRWQEDHGVTKWGDHGRLKIRNGGAMKTTKVLQLIAVIGFAGTSVFAQGDALTREDKEFLKNAAELGTTEVELGKLAAEKGGSEDIKKLGKKMAADHKKSNAELSKLAKNKKVDLKMESTAAQKQMISAFEKKTGAEFDKEFREHVAKDHKDAIKTFEDAAKDAKDPEVKAFAEKNLSTLKEHHSALSR